MWACRLLLMLQGSTLTVVGQFERDSTSSSLRLIIRGPRHVSYVYSKLHYLSVYVQEERSRSKS